MQRRTSLTRMALYSILGVATLNLSGCGFHLRGLGDTSLGVERLTLEAPNAPLTEEVQNALEQVGTKLDKNAPLRLTLGREETQERELGIRDAGNQDIELTLRAPFSVQRKKDGAYLIHPQQIEVFNVVDTQDSNLLARDDRLTEARQELRQRAAEQLLDRLRPLSVDSVR